MRSPEPALAPFPAERARRVRLVILDVDGVLTDAAVYTGRLPDGGDVELKRFDIQDGLGVKLLGRAGIRVVLVSGRPSEATTLRAREMGIECFQDPGAQKLPHVQTLMNRLGISWEEVAMVADDLPDLPVLVKVGLPVAVANAQPEVAQRALWHTRAGGGRGAVREFCRALLLARGEWDRVVGEYLSERSGA